MDATCTIQDSIHVFSLVHKYVSRILGTYQNCTEAFLCLFFRLRFVLKLFKYYAVGFLNLYLRSVHNECFLFGIDIEKRESVRLIIAGYQVFAVGEQRNVFWIFTADGKTEEFLKGTVRKNLVNAYTVIAGIGSRNVFKVI